MEQKMPHDKETEGIWGLNIGCYGACIDLQNMYIYIYIYRSSCVYMYL